MTLQSKPGCNELLSSSPYYSCLMWNRKGLDVKAEVAGEQVFEYQTGDFERDAGSEGITAFDCRLRSIRRSAILKSLH
jgi:hypothetical protein